MPQFIAFVYPEKRGFRVFIEGLGDASVATLAGAEQAATEIAARSVFASYLDRVVRERPGTAGLIQLEIRLVLVAPAEVGRSDRSSAGAARPRGDREAARTDANE